MRLIRTIAAGIAVILGLACVSLAAFGADAMKSITPNASDESDAASTRAIRPLDPNAGNTDTRMPQWSPLPDAFKSEFGKRGKHKVQVQVTGPAIYIVTWRGEAEPKTGRGNFSDTRTVNGGFPLVQVAIGTNATCTVTIDGIEKDHQATTTERPVEICSA